MCGAEAQERGRALQLQAAHDAAAQRAHRALRAVGAEGGLGRAGGGRVVERHQHPLLLSGEGGVHQTVPGDAGGRRGGAGLRDGVPLGEEHAAADDGDALLADARAVAAGHAHRGAAAQRDAGGRRGDARHDVGAALPAQRGAPGGPQRRADLLLAVPVRDGEPLRLLRQGPRGEPEPRVHPPAQQGRGDLGQLAAHPGRVLRAGLPPVPHPHPDRLGEQLQLLLPGEPVQRRGEGEPGGAVAVHGVRERDGGGAVLQALHQRGADRLPVRRERGADRLQLHAEQRGEQPADGLRAARARRRDERAAHRRAGGAALRRERERPAEVCRGAQSALPAPREPLRRAGGDGASAAALHQPPRPAAAAQLQRARADAAGGGFADAAARALLAAAGDRRGREGVRRLHRPLTHRGATI